MSSLRLTTQLQQKMVLTPQLRQRIEMLQMTSLELNELIEQEMVSNPVLEEVQSGEEVQEIGASILDQNSDGADVDYTGTGERGTSNDDVAATVPDGEQLNGAAERTAESDGDEEFSAEPSDSFDEIDFGREFQDYLDPGYRTQEIEYKDDAPSFEQFLTHAPSLSEHLEWQLNLMVLDPHIEEAATQIIGNLDEDGRLTVSIEDIASVAGLTAEIVEAARQCVLQLDPVGCGAKDVKECLLAQLEANGQVDTLACRLVRDHFEDLHPNRLQHLSKAT